MPGVTITVTQYDLDKMSQMVNPMVPSMNNLSSMQEQLENELTQKERGTNR